MSRGLDLTKRIGLTMAALGVLLAVCAAFVGAERTQAAKTLMAQKNAWDEYQSESMKDRMMTSELLMLDALTPTKAEADAFAGVMAKVRAGAGKGDNPEVMEALDVSSRELADVLSPDHEDGLHFAHVIRGYEDEREAAAHWAEAFDGATTAHFESGERYDHAELAAELGVVVASVALLFSSRPLWVFSLFLLVVCTGAATATWIGTHRRVAAADADVARLEQVYRDLQRRLEAKGEDTSLVQRILAGEETTPFGAR